jgi:HSP20 family protein
MAQSDNPRRREGQSNSEENRVSVQQQARQPSEARERGLTHREVRDPWSASPFSFMRRFSEDMDRLFEEFGFAPGLLSAGGHISRREFGRGMWHPQIEMFERGDDLVIRADLPGMKKEDIKVECTQDAIVIQGERRHEHSGESAGRFHSERSYGRFYREIPLPEGVKSEDAKANFRDGVLEIVMKAPQQSRPRRIDVQS